jgi:hypothetical protein
LKARAESAGAGVDGGIGAEHHVADAAVGWAATSSRMVVIQLVVRRVRVRRAALANAYSASGQTSTSARLSTFDLSRYMGASLTMIDRHYGHLARDGREHAIQLLDELNAGQRPRWTLVDTRWTPEGRPSISPDNESPPEQAEERSPLADSNRRPPPYHESRRQPVATHSNGFRLSEPWFGADHLLPVANGCDRSAP